MKKEDYARILNSSKNMITATVCQIAVAVLGIVERSVFINNLSEEYLGLSILFSSLLAVLSISELGLGSAMAFCLYSPLAGREEGKIRALLRFMATAYRWIGLLILVLGFALIPFLPLVSKTTIPMGDVRLYYLIYLLGVAIGYFFSYSAVLVEADQKQYINTIVINTIQILQSLIQMYVLIKTQNFLIYTIVFACGNILRYVIIQVVTHRIYPFIRRIDRTADRLDSGTKQLIGKNIKALVIHKIGGTVIGSSDSIMISTLLGMGILGMYSNYQLLLVGISSGVAIIYSSMNASIGNICALEKPEISYDWFMRINTYYSLLIGALCTVLAVCLNPLMSVLFPSAKQFPQLTVILLACSNYFTYMRKIVTTFEDAYGLFWYDRYKSIVEIVINIVGSIVLSYWFGLDGIIIGTILSTLLVCAWVEPVVVFRYGFRRSLARYVFNYIRSFAVFLIATVLGSLVCSSVDGEGLFSLVVKIVLCLFVYCILTVVFAPKTVYNMLHKRRMDIV